MPTRIAIILHLELNDDRTQHLLSHAKDRGLSASAPDLLTFGVQ